MSRAQSQVPQLVSQRVRLQASQPAFLLVLRMFLPASLAASQEALRSVSQAYHQVFQLASQRVSPLASLVVSQEALQLVFQANQRAPPPAYQPVSLAASREALRPVYSVPHQVSQLERQQLSLLVYLGPSQLVLRSALLPASQLAYQQVSLPAPR